MDSGRWQRLNELFHAALDRPAAERATFLADACGDDAALRVEAESLLANHAEDDDFLETPAAAAYALLDEPSLVGRELAQYRVLEELGRGGMGVVYLAEDTRLGRRVAIKALVSRVTAVSRQRERLRNEARVLAALSHPGIATVYAFEELDGHQYIVSEYVPGRTLRQELNDGPLPLDRLVATGLAIANALAAAHLQGIVHRDLKPENVIRRTDGGGDIKVLDFGLARQVGDDGVAAMSIDRLTRAGMILGTPGYMSPEQLRGEEVDARTDIFSLGVVLYELATGLHPFAADDPASAIARILEVDPVSLDILRPQCPASLARILHDCLQKDRARRPTTADALAASLARLDLDATDSPAASTRPTNGARPARGARWWWQFHQLAVAVGYFVMLAPLWIARDWRPGIIGLLPFFLALAVASAAANLRLHLWFTSRQYPDALSTQRRRIGPWARWVDGAFAGLLMVGGSLAASLHPEAAALLIAGAVTTALAFLVIEPATTRAAFPPAASEPLDR